MSLRIKIPPVNNSAMNQPSHPVRSKSNKRVATVLSSDEEDARDRAPPPPPSKRPRYSDSNSDEHVDVDDSYGDEDSSFAPPVKRSPPVQRKASLKKRAGSLSSAKGRSSKARKTMDESDDDFEDAVVSDDLGGGYGNDIEDDEEFIEEPKKKSKSKAPAKGKGTKGSKNAKGKGKAEEKEIVVRDERLGLNGEPPQSSAKIRIKPSPSVDTGPGSETATDHPAAPDAESSAKDDAPPPPKKRKLPTIKKNKAQGSGPLEPPAAQSKSGKTASTDAIVATPATPATRVPPALQGADFNLQDRGVYDMLFKNTGGSTPSTGLNRRAKEEQRRKELDKLRNDDRAKRALEAKHTFDLQAQTDKISAFEDRLLRGYSSVLYPNILGAKMKDMYERRRAPIDWDKQREPPEEGEM